MHIVQLLPALNEGGVERGTIELNREFVRKGHRSTVISAGGGLVDKVIADGGIHCVLDVKSKNPLSALWRVARLRKLLAELQPSIVHYRSRVPGWLFTLANRNLRLPFVSTVHGFNSVSCYSRVMTLGERVICPGCAVVDYVKQHYGVSDERIRLIYRGIDPQRFARQRLDQNFIKSFEDRYGLRDAFVVLAVGRVTRLKGYEVLIRAIADARVQLPNIKCVIVGGAENNPQGYLASLQSLARELEIEDQVVFAGSQSKMAEIYACADVLTSNNPTKPEAFGRSMIEALALDCPVVASRFGGALDIVDEGRNGFLYTPGDYHELAGLLVRVAATKFTGMRDDVFTRFGLDGMVDKTLAVYQEVLQEHGSL